MTLTTSEAAQQSVEPERDSLPGTLEFIRALLAAQAAPGWGKLCVEIRVAGNPAQYASAACTCSLRGSDELLPIAVADASALSAVLLELHRRLQEEMTVNWRSIKLEYDADEQYAVSISTQ